VFGGPARRLNLVERRRGPPIADDGPAAGEAPVAEPLSEHLLTGYFISPDRRRHVLDITLADAQSSFTRVVIHLVRQWLRCNGNGALRGNSGRLLLRKAWRPGGAILSRVRESLTEGVEPDNLLPQLH